MNTPIGHHIQLITIFVVAFSCGCTQKAEPDILEEFANRDVRSEWSGNIRHEEVEIPGQIGPRNPSNKEPEVTFFKYGDSGLAAAENVLTTVYPRPWTLKKVLSWYSEASNVEHKVALLRLLGVTRSMEAAWIHGQELEAKCQVGTKDWRVHLSAIDNINDYFAENNNRSIELTPEGRSRSAREWWEGIKERIGKRIKN